MNPILEIKNIQKVFENNSKSKSTSLDNVSFDLSEGEILGIVGESGSGKSTLAKIVVGLIPATSGSICLNQLEVNYLKKKDTLRAYKKIQMIFQSPYSSFNPRKTLGYSISEGFIRQGASRQEAKLKSLKLLEKCGLPVALFQKYPSEVSGGQCQRAAIARGISLNPAILICDEITSALDVSTQKNILSLIKELQLKNKMSVIFISHDLAVIQQISDRVLVMRKGVVVEQGITDTVIQTPQHNYTKELIKSIF